MNKITGRKRVLVVDDDEMIVKFISLKLKIAGYDVITAKDGYEGLKLVETTNPDLMVLDLLMPVMDGFDVLRKLRPSSDLPVIVLTAKADAFDEALGLGANDFIAKPFNPEELLKRVRICLNHKR